MCYRFYLKGCYNNHREWLCIGKYNPLRDEVKNFGFIRHILQAKEMVKKANETRLIETEDDFQQPSEPLQETNYATSVRINN